MDDLSPAQTVDRVVGMRLPQFQRATRLPVVFGGATLLHRPDRQLRIGHARGTLGEGLVGLDVSAGRGLGGSALTSGSLRVVGDYASTSTITHDFDGIVVQQERLSSVFALPIVVDRTVKAVVYGAVRGVHRIGDVVLQRATAFGASLEAELAGMVASPTPVAGDPLQLRHTREAIAELTELARSIPDASRRSAITRLAEELRVVLADEGRPPVRRAGRALAPREIDVLRWVAVGRTNAEVAASLGLGVETVRAYLRSAMRKLGVANRTAAVHAARELGAL